MGANEATPYEGRPAPAREAIGNPISPEATLAILARQAQWEIDRVAFGLPEGKITTSECRSLADVLSGLSALLHKVADERDAHG